MLKPGCIPQEIMRFGSHSTPKWWHSDSPYDYINTTLSLNLLRSGSHIHVSGLPSVIQWLNLQYLHHSYTDSSHPYTSSRTTHTYQTGTCGVTHSETILLGLHNSCTVRCNNIVNRLYACVVQLTPSGCPPVKDESLGLYGCTIQTWMFPVYCYALPSSPSGDQVTVPARQLGNARTVWLET